MRLFVLLAALSLGALGATPAGATDPLGSQALSQIVPGHSTKAELRARLGAPWRIVQFDDCGQAMAGQADETWEYRGTGSDGPYRLHVEFDEHGVVHLISEILENSGASGAIAVAVPDDAALCLSM